MAGYQFTHYEAYSRKKAKGSAKRSLCDIAAEADRDICAHPHVVNPLPPRYIGGLPFKNFTAAQKAISAAADLSRVSQVTIDKHTGEKKEVKKKLRKDANIAIGLVASYPTSIQQLNELEPDQRAKELERIQRWVSDVLKFAESEWPGMTQCAAVHLDENFPHLHLMLGSTTHSDDFKTLHKGELARKLAVGNNRSSEAKKLGNDAYKAAMRSYQDRYFEHVGSVHGQARLGPGRDRLTRREWVFVQKQMNAIKEAHEKANEQLMQAKASLEEASSQSTVIRSEARNEAFDILEQAMIDAELEAESFKEDLISAATSEAEKKTERVNEIIRKSLLRKEEADFVCEKARKLMESAQKVDRTAKGKMVEALRKEKSVNEKEKNLSSFFGFLHALFGFKNQAAKMAALWERRAYTMKKKYEKVQASLQQSRVSVNEFERMAPKTVEQVQRCNDKIFSIEDDELREKMAFKLRRLVMENSKSISGNFNLKNELEEFYLDLEQEIEVSGRSVESVQRKWGLNQAHEL